VANTADKIMVQTMRRASYYSLWADSLRILELLAKYILSVNGGIKVELNNNDLYRAVFKEYPDVLDVKQVSALLGVSTKTVYRLLHGGDLDSLKIGREFRIPKVYLMKYVKVFGSAMCVQPTA